MTGSYGVTVFFVISGYLITGLLLAESVSTGSIGVAAFYRRRFARLAPALLAVLGLSVAWLLATGIAAGRWFAGLGGALTYSTDVLESTAAQPHVSTYFEWSWSLAIEEQFYLIWPVLLIGLLCLGGRVGRALLVTVSALVIALAWLSRAAMVESHAGHARVNFSFDSHMDAIAFGAIVAAALAAHRFGARVRAVAGVAATVSAIVLGVAVADADLIRRPVPLDADAFGQVAIVCAVLVAGLVIAPSGRLARLLARRPLVHLGRLSYGLYLWNMLLRDVFLTLVGHRPALAGWAGIAWLVLLLVVAEVSYRYVETPLRRRWAHRVVRTEPAVVTARPELVSAS